MKELHGRILTPSGLVRGTIRFGERIEEIVPGEVDGSLLLPGFIDVHVHGGGGGDTMDGPDGVRQLAHFHLRHGTTTLLPTTITNPWPKVLYALDSVAQVRDDQSRDIQLRDTERRGTQAREAAKMRDAQLGEIERRPATNDARSADLLPDLLGAHLEGPFISPERLGAQPANTLPPQPERVREVLGKGVVKLVTIAPELPGAVEAAREFVAAGVVVSIGHTRADYDTVAAYAKVVRDAAGVLGFTHLFNAMGGINGRAPGTAGAALALVESYAELIFDGNHVAQGSLHLARAAKRGRLMLVSDCIRAGGMGDGKTELGGQKVTVSKGAARLDDGTLAGSVLTLDQALRNVLRAGVPLPEASAMLSAVPARYLGLADRGELAVGKRADIVGLDEGLEVVGVHVGGRRLSAGTSQGGRAV